MLKLFLYDNDKQCVIINAPDILLIKEFSDLWDSERNKSAKDKTGEKRERAYRELKYIYLAIDWRSPYNQYMASEKHEMSLIDADLTLEEFDDPVFRSACRKYQSLQETSIIGSLLQAQYNTIHKMKVYYDNIDLEEKKEDGSRVNKTKDVLAEMSATAKALDGLKALEEMWKKEQESESELRGDSIPGFNDK